MTYDNYPDGNVDRPEPLEHYITSSDEDVEELMIPAYKVYASVPECELSVRAEYKMPYNSTD
jgi:hypothetical protein